MEAGCRHSSPRLSRHHKDTGTFQGKQWERGFSDYAGMELTAPDFYFCNCIYFSLPSSLVLSQHEKFLSLRADFSIEMIMKWNSLDPWTNLDPQVSKLL